MLQHAKTSQSLAAGNRVETFSQPLIKYFLQRETRLPHYGIVTEVGSTFCLPVVANDISLSLLLRHN